MTPHHRQDDDGFTLVEVLVGLAVVALALPALLEVFAVGASAIRASDQEYEAVRLAASKLATAGVEIPFADRHATGRTESGLAWTLDMRPAADGPPVGSYGGYRVTATVTWRAGPARLRPRTVTLETLKIGRP